MSAGRAGVLARARAALTRVLSPILRRMPKEVTTEPARGRRVVRTSSGAVVADTGSALLLHESGHPVRTYFPREDVDMSLLEESTFTSHCPYKGDARYWHVGEARDAAWSYEDPFDVRRDITGMIGFWEEKGVVIGER